MDTSRTSVNSDTTPNQAGNLLSISEADLLAELARDYEETQIKPGEITYRMFADYKNIKNGVAKCFLQLQYERKKLTRRDVVVDGKHTWAYSKCKLGFPYLR